MSDNVREYVLNQLPIPAEWRSIDVQRIPDVIERETVIVKHARIEKLPEAPNGHLRNEVILAVFIPNRDLARAENRLDLAVLDLIGMIDKHPYINWSEAEKVITPNGAYPGWEISLTVNTEATPDTPTPESEAS